MIKTANAVIIGAGVIGTSITSFLSEKMEKVVLIDREGVATRASGSCYGMIWTQLRKPGTELNITRRTYELYDELIQNHFKIDVELEKLGGLTVGLTDAQYLAMDSFVKERRALGMPIMRIDGKETRELEPNLSKEVKGAVYCKEDMQINPYKTVMAFAELARRRGAEILTGTEAHRINVKNGKVKSVETSAGIIETEKVVVSAGAWSRLLVKDLGIDLPIYPQRQQSLVTEPREKLLYRTMQAARELSEEDAINHPEYLLECSHPVEGHEEKDLPQIQQEVEETVFPYLKPTVSGTVVLGCTFEYAGYDRRTSIRGISAVMETTARICPKLKDAQIIRTWADFTPYTFDFVPIYGKRKDYEGLYIAAGHPHAFSHAPAVGEMFATLLTDEKSLNAFGREQLEYGDVHRYDPN
jgi:glycine/D-amino acid oxidase-like deaminating enzyme